MDNLERRILTLELEAKHERELIEWRIADLSHRLQTLERSPLRQIPVGSIGKIVLAVALPLIVLLGTGDLRRVLAAIRLAAGG